MNDVTQILSAIEAGDDQAAEKLLPLVYDELRRLAAIRLAQESPGQTLQATALVHEAYLRLLGPEGGSLDWANRGHFFAAAAEAMRRILIDVARRKQAVRHGGGYAQEEMPRDVAVSTDITDVVELIALDESLEKLARHDPTKAKLVELRFFGGLSNAEAAKVLGISPKTADRYWAFARAWLRMDMEAWQGDRAIPENS